MEVSDSPADCGSCGWRRCLIIEPPEADGEAMVGKKARGDDTHALVDCRVLLRHLVPAEVVDELKPCARQELVGQLVERLLPLLDLVGGENAGDGRV
jgi:hypothetical protein